MIPDWHERAQLVADDLMGTCDTLEQVLERRGWEGSDNIMDFCNALDDRVFCCCVCDWWDEAGNARDHGGHDQVCEDCDDFT